MAVWLVFGSFVPPSGSSEHIVQGQGCEGDTHNDEGRDDFCQQGKRGPETKFLAAQAPDGRN